uniref:Reverse transcriptase domain-containing protein n=1 Tax=Tanacetum cinerariifolium TaxID=118510 RepID=A0A699GXW4_TANCI|nr:reverse transcriptase domain-containing protein [Tanacetum cinerariifolium]
MAQLLQAPTEGYEDAIVVPAITADNFKLKHGILTIVQNKQFFGHDKEDPHAHVRYFNKITSTLKFPNIPNTSIKLMLFPFSLEGAARIWLEKEPSRSIFTWDDLVSKFINQFFPPSKTTNLHNEITNFQQRFDESFSEAWDRFKDLLKACHHHGFSELHKLDTFYNALNSKDQDSLNSAVGGNFLDKMPRECLAIIESKSKVHYSRNKPVVAKVSMNTSTSGISPDVAELKDKVKALLLDKKSQNQSPATVKTVEESCVTCGGAHSYRNYPTTDGNVYRDNIQEFVSQATAVNYNQGNTIYRSPMMSNQIRPPGFAPVLNNQNQMWGLGFKVFWREVMKEKYSSFKLGCRTHTTYVKANDAVMRNMQTQGKNMQNQLTNLTDLITKFVNSNSASTSRSGTLPSNTIANPRSDLKAITTRCGVSYNGPQIPPSTSFLPKVVENKPEATKDTLNPTNNESTEDVQPQDVQSESLILNSEPVNSPISKPVIALMFKDMSFKISFADALILMPKFASTLKALIGNKEMLSKMARTSLNEHCSTVLLKKLPERLGDPGKFLIPCDLPGMAECLPLVDLGESINLMPFSVWKRLSLLDLTPTCMTLELADRSITRLVGVAEDVYVKVGSFHFSINFVVVDFDADPRVPLILRRSILKTGRALIDVFEGSSRFFDVIASGNPTPYYDSIVSTTSPTLTPFGNSDFLLEEVDAFLAIEDDPTSPEVDQSYLDPEEDILLLEAFLNDDPSLPPPSHGNYLPEVRKELKIYEAKSDKSLIDEPLEIELKDLPPYLEYAFLEGDDKLPVIITKDLSVEEKTALITVLKSHKRAIAWKLSDIKGIDPEFYTHKILMKDDFKPAVQHQRKVSPKIHDVIKQEVIKLLDAGLIYLISDSPWVSPVHCVPKKGGFIVVENEDNELTTTPLVTVWRVSIDYRKLNEATRKDHFPLPFMDQMLERLARNQYYYFLDGHAGFYNRFIKDFSKIARPMTKLLEKDTPFIFSKECVEAFQTLKRKLTKAPILIALDWDMPFDVMCDASDFAIGAVLGQRQDKHFRPIHYASKTMTEAKSNYTTTEKEMLGVVYAFEKFRSYLIMNKSIVYTDHSALKYLFAKKDSKVRLLCWVILLQEFTFKVIDTKGAENLAANHLSRLENPHQNVLGPKEINESFPLETLNLVSTRENQSTTWFADFANYHAGNFVVKGCRVYQAKKPLKFSKLATIDPQEDTMAQITQPRRKVQINELCDQAYENYLIYKEKTKRLHDSKIKDRVFNIGNRVLLFNSRLKTFSGKLKSHWSGPFTISQVYPYGTVKLSQPDVPNFKFNGHCVKHYFGEDIPKLAVPDLQTFPRDH